jgi:peptidoglycan hydrolase-like protein with peptidoglycan-binding domain
MKTALRATIVASFLVVAAVPALAHDSDLERAQQALKQAGHDPGPIDGVPGARTLAALKAFQRSQGLSETGRLDEVTRARLNEKKASGSAPTGGDGRPSAVDPAQSTRTGANTGDGASYSRSTEKGLSASPSSASEPKQ